MADLIEVRSTVALPAGTDGRGVAAGDVILVDPGDAVVASHLRVGLLVPIVPQPMPDKLRPPRARKGTPES